MTINWSEFARHIVTAITKPDNRIDGMKLKDFMKLLKKQGFSVDEKSIDSENFRRMLKILMSAMGFMVNDNIESFLDVNTRANCITQFSPILEYISKRFLRRFASSFNNTDKKTAICALVKKNSYTDYLMEIVSEKQLDSHAFTNSKNENMNNTSDETRKNSNDDTLNMISALKVENQKLRKQIEKSRVSGGDDQLLIERIEESIKDVLPELKFVSEKWSGDSTFRKNEHGTAVLHISDWHIGSNENVDGFNNFNYEIACERVKTLTNKYISWTKMHRAMYSIDELVIIATGDMISGDIHEELLRTNEFSVPEQCVKAATLISKLTNSLSPFFKKVRVEYIVADNHSRTTKKIQFGDGKNSYNYIVGYMSKLLLANTTNVEFNLYPEIQHVIRVEQLRYLITHGNCVRGGFAGIPFYSMQRKVGAEAAVRMNMGDSYHFDKIVMGHYHVPIRSTQYEMTGCLSSTTAFDQSSGRHCRACQTGWIVSKDNEIDYYELWLS